MTPRAKLSTSLDGRLLVETPYSPATVALCRDQIDPRRRWSPMEKAWSYPCEPCVIERLMDAFNLTRDQLPEGVRGLAPKAKEVPALKPKMELIEGYRFLTDPYPHQCAGLAFLLEYDHFLLSWEQGLGKTKTVCDRLNHTFAGPVLILCPKSVKFTWKKELWEHGRLCGEVWPEYGPEDIANGDCGILIANYDALVSDKNLARFLKVKWQVIVGDELQMVKRSTAKRSKSVMKLGAAAKYRWGLSGTPAPNGAQDWFGILSFLDTSICGTTSKTAFEFRYCIKERMESGGARIVGYQNLNELNEKVAKVSDRRLKEDCLKDLPPKLFLDRFCELSKPAQKIYNDIRRNAVARIATAKKEGTLTARNILVEGLRLLQIAGGWVKDDEDQIHALLPNSKIELLGDVLEEIGNQSVVIWCAFLEELHAVAAMLASAGRNVRTFHGDLKDQDRKAAVEDFQAGRADVFLATAAAGGTGLTLTAASNEIFYSRTWNLEHYSQAQDRCHRIGQTKTVNIYRLMARVTVDEKIAAALETKADLQELVMRRGAEELL